MVILKSVVMKIKLLALLFLTSFKMLAQNEQSFVKDTLKPLCFDMKSGYKLLTFDNKEFKILNVVYIDSTLQIEYSYGGGCGKSFLDIYVDHMNDFKNDELIPLYPKFIDEDTCKAIKRRKVCFNVEELLKDHSKPLAFKIIGYDKIVKIK